jgi:type IV pilus assembly protein PilB
MEAARHPWPALGVLLIRDGLVTPEQLDEVLARQGDHREQRISSQRLGEALVGNGIVTSAQIARLVAEQHELPFVDLDEPDAMVPLSVRLPDDLARSHCALPIRAFPDGSVLVAVGDPTRPGCFDDVRSALGVPVRFVVAAPDAIITAIEASGVSTTTADGLGDEELHEDEPPASTIGADRPAVTALEDRSIEPRAGVGRWPLLGSLLLRDGLVSADDLYAALAQQRLTTTKQLGELLVARGSLTDDQLSRALAEQHELPFVELSELEIDRAAASRLPLDVARAHFALPISQLADDALLLVVADPTSARYADELRAALGVSLQFAVASSEDINAAIESLARNEREPAHEPIALVDDESEPRNDREPAHEPIALVDDESEPRNDREPAHEPIALGDDESEPKASDFQPLPVPEPEPSGRDDSWERPKAVRDAVERAVAAGATAVHFTSGPDGLTVRARIDRALTEIEVYSDLEADAADRALAELDDVRPVILVADDQTFELRPTTVTTTIGRRTTFRVVTEEQPGHELDDVFPEEVARTLRGGLERDAGLVVICGPAAVSRAAALRATMRELVSTHRLILSVEDPVAFLVSGVGQTEVDAVSGLTYPVAVQSILRSDPDVAVVAELLDRETALLAVRGARERLVLTTLDAPTSASALRQLIDFGIGPKALADAHALVIGHATVHRLCEACRESYYASEGELVDLGRPLDELGRRLLGRRRGCEACGGTGYRDDIDIFEALTVPAALTEVIARAGSIGQVEHVAVAADVRTLRAQMVDLCLDGLTSTEELRALGLSGMS